MFEDQKIFEFWNTVTSYPYTEMLFNNLEFTSYGAKYLFDGYMICALVIQGNDIIDVQDIDETFDPATASLDYCCRAETGTELAKFSIDALTDNA